MRILSGRRWVVLGVAVTSATVVLALLLPSVFAADTQDGGGDPNVELAGFEARWASDGQSVNLAWETTQESGVDRFVVESSGDGVRWVTVAKAGAAGHSDTPLDYAVVDGSASTELDYTRYRLQATGGGLTVLVGTEIVVQRPIDCRPIFANTPYEELLGTAQSEGSASIIVGLTLDGHADDDGGVVTKASDSDQAPKIPHAAIATAQDALLASLAAAGARVTDVGRMENIPFVAMHIDAVGLTKLKNTCGVGTVEEDCIAEPQLDDSTVQVRADHAWDAGHTGAGTTVAVIDTGVETSHSFFAGKVVDEMCFSASGANSLCPNGQATQTGTGSGVNCNGSIADCNHGTLVAGIALGKTSTRSGVAPDANLIAVQAAHRVTTTTGCDPDPAPCARFSSTNYNLALDRLLTLKNSSQPELVAVNMSLGGGEFQDFCDNQFPSTTAAIEALRAANVAVIAASGNDSVYDGMKRPACISAAISVGAVKADDKPADFSNRAYPDFLDLFAPGVAIETSGLGNSFQETQGTSMAAPHVAGAWAVLRENKPNMTVDQAEEIFKETGEPAIVAGPFPWDQDWVYVPRVNVYHRQEGRAWVDKDSLAWSPEMGVYHTSTSGKLARAFWKHTKWNFNKVYAYNDESVESEIAIDPATSRAYAVSGGRAIGTFINTFGQIEFEELDYRTDKPLIHPSSMVWGFNMRSNAWGQGSGLYAIDVTGDPILLHFPNGTTDPLNYVWVSINVDSGASTMQPGSLISVEMDGGWGRIFAINADGRAVFSDSDDYQWQQPSLRIVPGQIGTVGVPYPEYVPGSLCAINENEAYAVNVNEELVRLRLSNGFWTLTTLNSPWAGNWGGKIKTNSLECGESRVFGINEQNKVVTTWNETVVTLQGQDGLNIVSNSLVELQDAELYGVDTQNRMVKFVWTSGGGGWSASFVLSPWSGNWAGQVQPGSIVASPTKVYAVNERGNIVNTWNGVLVEL